MEEEKIIIDREKNYYVDYIEIPIVMTIPTAIVYVIKALKENKNDKS